MESGEMLYFVGTRTTGRGRGIYRCSLNGTGIISEPELATEVDNPTFFALSRDKRLLFCVCEMRSAETRKQSSVRSFSLQMPRAELNPINQQSSGGEGPCHVCVSRDNRSIYVANYGSGSIVSVSVSNSGYLEEGAQIIHHEGKSIHSTRQEGPHAHSVNLSLEGNILFACDLGIDSILLYKVDSLDGSLSLHQEVRATEGAGPRHLAIHPNGNLVFVINELACTITSYTYDSQHGSLSENQNISTLPDSFSGENTSSEVVVAKDGRFLYGANRGDDSIAIFAIDEQTGNLNALGHRCVEGETPRHFTIDPTGNFLLVANEGSSEVVWFARDNLSGDLKDITSRISLPNPMCIRFL